MDRRFPTLIKILLSLSLSITALYSQNPKETVSVDFRVFGAGLDSFEKLYFYDGKIYTLLEFNKTSRSTKTYSYRGAPRIGIFTNNPKFGPQAPDEPKFLQLASQDTVSSTQNGLLLFVANPKNRKVGLENRHYKLFLIDDSEQGFPENTIHVVNATDVDLHGRIASERIDLSNNSSSSVSYSDYAAKEKLVPIAFAFKTSKGPQLAMSNDIPLPKNRRVVLVLMNPRREGSIRIDVRALMDTLPDPDPEYS